MSDYQIFDVRVSTLTPLHIGNGRNLLHQYDYAIHNRQTWRIDEVALLDAQTVDDIGLANRLAQTAPAELLLPSDYRPDSPFFRYTIQGTPRSEGKGAQVSEQLKDAFDRPYLPGSSLKGALRTGIAWHAWQVRGATTDIRQLNRNRQWAGQSYEQQLFGKTPNQDLMRALQVSDSRPLTSEHLLIANVSVLSRHGQIKAPIEMEAIRPDSVFELTLKVDQALFSQWAQRAGLQPKEEAWLLQLPVLMQARAQDRARRELAWFQNIGTAIRLTQFYQQLAAAILGSNRFLIQLGWGTGWDDKTFGSRLQGDPKFMERIIRDYRMAMGKRQEGDPFPSSRRVAVGSTRAQDGRRVEVPVSALGWCLVEMEKRA